MQKKLKNKAILKSVNDKTVKPETENPETSQAPVPKVLYLDDQAKFGKHEIDPVEFRTLEAKYARKTKAEMKDEEIITDAINDVIERMRKRAEQ